jgi:hypothetical protein
LSLDDEDDCESSPPKNDHSSSPNRGDHASSLSITLEKTKVSIFSSLSSSIFIILNKIEVSSSSSAQRKQISHPPPPPPKTRSKASSQSQKRSLDSVANAPKVDPKKEKDDQWQRYKLDEPKNLEKFCKDDCIKFWNLFASLPEWREVQIQKANRE